MTSPPDLQRAEDAAFFEDWSEWASLDGLPRRPAGVARGPDSRWCVYWLNISVARRGFVICAASAPVRDLIARIPGARRERKDRYDLCQTYWYIPAASWRDLRASLPRIKAETIAYLATHAHREAQAIARLRHRERMRLEGGR